MTLKLRATERASERTRRVGKMLHKFIFGAWRFFFFAHTHSGYFSGAQRNWKMKRDRECMEGEQKECPNMLFTVDKCTCILRALDGFCSMQHVYKVNQIKPVQRQQIPRRLQLSDKNLKNLILHLLCFLLSPLCHIGRRMLRHQSWQKKTEENLWEIFIGILNSLMISV